MSPAWPTARHIGLRPVRQPRASAIGQGFSAITALQGVAGLHLRSTAEAQARRRHPELLAIRTARTWAGNGLETGQPGDDHPVDDLWHNWDRGTILMTTVMLR